MKRGAALAFFATLFALLIFPLQAAPLPEFEVGQYWALRADAKQHGAEVLVLKIDPDPVLGQIIFVDIENLQEGGKPSTLTFVPVSRSALRLSVDHYLKRVSYKLSVDERAYKKWKSQTINGKQVVVTEPLQQFVDRLFR